MLEDLEIIEFDPNSRAENLPVSPITKKLRNTDDVVNVKGVNVKRIKELKSNFLNKYVYSAIGIFILLLVAIFYFVSR